MKITLEYLKNKLKEIDNNIDAMTFDDLKNNGLGNNNKAIKEVIEHDIFALFVNKDLERNPVVDSKGNPLFIGLRVSFNTKSFWKPTAKIVGVITNYNRNKNQFQITWDNYKTCKKWYKASELTLEENIEA